MTARLGPASTAPIKSAAILVLIGLAGLVGAVAITTDHLDLALIIAGAVFALSVIYSKRLSLSGWCVLMLLATVAARAPTTLLGLPAILEFSHYGVALAFAYAAAGRPKLTGRTNSGKWLWVLLVLTVASALANASHPMRALFFIVILGEPLLVIWCIERWGTDELSERRLGVFLVLLMAIQVPIGLWQGLTMGWNDPVQGTLMGHGAGAHVLGGLFALTAIVAAAGVQGHRIPALYALGAGAVALGMIGAAGAMAVLVLTGISLAIIPLTGSSGSGSGKTPRIRASALLVAVLGTFGALYFAQLLLPDLVTRATKLISFGAFPETDIIEERLRDDPARLILGSGPGTSGSRASLLLTAPEFEQGSPLAALQLPPTEIGLELRKKDDIARQRYGGSAETTASTALGFIGDLGLAGLVSLVALYAAVWGKAGQKGTWLAAAVRASICLISMLMFLDNWLEYPEFVIPLAMMIGFGIRGVRSPSDTPSRAVLHESPV